MGSFSEQAGAGRQGLPCAGHGFQRRCGFGVGVVGVSPFGHAPLPDEVVRRPMKIGGK